MNKLLVSDIINLNSGIYILEFSEVSATINIVGNVTLYIINDKIENLIINIEDNSKLDIYKYDRLLNNNLEIIINEGHDIVCNYNGSFISKKDIFVKINNYIKGNNNESKINLRNICNDNFSKIEINVDIYKNTINNIALEDLKGINNGGFIQIEPNIKCNSNEVIANHLTTIGVLDKDSINYLMSKGLNEEECRKILLNGFIMSNMDDYIKNLGGE